MTTEPNRAEALHKEKLECMRNLWVICNELSWTEVMSKSDHRIWGAVCEHEDIQALLDAAFEKKGVRNDT